MNRPSGQPRPGASALCGEDGGRLGVMTTYVLAHVTCRECVDLYENLSFA